MGSVSRSGLESGTLAMGDSHSSLLVVSLAGVLDGFIPVGSQVAHWKPPKNPHKTLWKMKRRLPTAQRASCKIESRLIEVQIRDCGHCSLC